MSKPSKKRLAKKKERERDNQKKMAIRRQRMRKEKSEDRRLKKVEKDAEPKLEPIRNLAAPPKSQEEIMAQIERNLEVLRALEDEYTKEAAEREGLNRALEEEGYTTLREKLDFLNKQAEESAKEAYEKRIKSAMEK